MNYLYIAVAVIILAGGYYFFASQANAPVDTGDTTLPTDTGTMDEVPVTNAMPVPGVPDVDEMVVTEESADDGQASDDDAAVKVFDVEGINFAFDVEEIRVKEGDTVTINFHSDEGFHDWVVDEFNAATEKVRPGTPTSVTFVADKAGTYEYYCSVGSHRAQGMVGKLVVE